MRTKHGVLSIGIAIAALLSAPTAQAHELTKKKAKAALKPVAAELVPTVGPVIAQKLPGSTIAGSSVGGCEIRKSHRAECVISFSVQGASTGQTECVMDALVRFRSARSRELRTSVGPVLLCLFPVPLNQ
jgi:hypothetical protein